MSVFSKLSSEQLRKAADLKDKIRKLENALAELAGKKGWGGRPDKLVLEAPRKKRKISASGIARIKAAQKLRWAKYKQQLVPVVTNGANGLGNVKSSR